MYSNIEIETGLINGDVTANVFKFNEEFATDSFKIEGKLPGHDKDLNYKRWDK